MKMLKNFTVPIRQAVMGLSQRLWRIVSSNDASNRGCRALKPLVWS